MDSFIIYLLKVGIALAFFYCIYYFFLRYETFFKANRFYLLLCSLVSLVLPFLYWEIRIPSNEVFYVSLREIVLYASGEPGLSVQRAGVNVWLLAYQMGFVLFSAVFVFRNLQIALLFIGSEKKRLGNISLILVNRDMSPFSYLGYVFVNKEQVKAPGFETILLHESMHVKQFHSFDLLVAELLLIFQWFNLFSWFFRHALKENHEYLADQGVLRQGIDKAAYQHTIVNQLFGLRYMALANNLNKSLIKKRIIMMKRQKSNNRNIFKPLLALPLAFLLVLAFSFGKGMGQVAEIVKISDRPAVLAKGKVIETQDSKVVVATVSDRALKKIQKAEKVEEKVYFVVEKMPKFNGGPFGDFRRYIAKELNYPEAAAKGGVQGKIFVRFVVDESGEVKDVKVVRSSFQDKKKGEKAEIYKLLEDEALRVVNDSPKWVPGYEKGKAVKVAFTFPVNFVLR